MRSLFWVATALAALIAAIFAASNRQSVELGFWPLPDLLPLPLYLVVLLVLILGFLAGRIAGWFGGQSLRTERRRLRRRIDELEADLAKARRTLPPASPPPGQALAVTPGVAPSGNRTLAA